MHQRHWAIPVQRLPEITPGLPPAMRNLLQLPQRLLAPQLRLRATTIAARSFRTSEVHRAFHSSRFLRQEHSDPAAHRNFYKTHGRALFKALTLAFFTYQVVYWAWLVLETEEVKAQKNEEIGSLEKEVRSLMETRNTGASDDGTAEGLGRRLLEEKVKK